jgi:DNA-binding transcriptional LysR family regulator
VITVLGFVAAGLGISILPGSLRNVRAEGIAFRPLRHGPSVDIGLAYRRDESSRTLFSFLEVVREIARQRRLRPIRKVASA